MDAGTPPARRRGNHACGFYWTEGNTGLGWAVDAIPPLKGKRGAYLIGSKKDQITFVKAQLKQIASKPKILAMKPGFRDDGFILGKRMMIPDRRAGHRYQQPPDQRQSVSNDICLWRYRFLTAREYEVPLGTQQRGSPMTKRIVSMVAVRRRIRLCVARNGAERDPMVARDDRRSS